MSNMKNTKIISICNWKGGVGKTTTAINLSYSLTNEEFQKRVLLIDNDPQANATSGIGYKVKNIENSIYGILKYDKPLLEGIMPTGYKNFDLIPSVGELTDLEVELSTRMQREILLQKAMAKSIEELKTYDYIIIDNNPGIGLLTVNSLAASDYAILPIEPSAFSFDGLARLLNIIEMVQNINNNLKIMGILLTRVDKRTNLEDFFRKNLELFSNNIFFTTIYQNVDVSKSQMANMPIEKYNPQAKSAKEYIELANEVIERTNKNIIDLKKIATTTTTTNNKEGGKIADES
jgi:chromosome partitioning protein